MTLFHPVWSPCSLRPWRRYRTIFLSKSIAAWPDLEVNSCNYKSVYHVFSMQQIMPVVTLQIAMLHTSTILTLDPHGTPISGTLSGLYQDPNESKWSVSTSFPCFVSGKFWHWDSRLRFEDLSQGASNCDLRRGRATESGERQMANFWVLQCVISIYFMLFHIQNLLYLTYFESYNVLTRDTKASKC